MCAPVRVCRVGAGGGPVSVGLSVGCLRVCRDTAARGLFVQTASLSPSLAEAPSGRPAGVGTLACAPDSAWKGR